MADTRAVREPRRETSPARTEYRGARCAREFLKCAFCRKDSKRCDKVQGQNKCQRCIEKGRPCGPRLRKHPIPRQMQARDEYLATCMAALIFLSTAKGQNIKLSADLGSFPYFNVESHGEFDQNQDPRDPQEFLISKIRLQTHHISRVSDELHHETISIWNGAEVTSSGSGVQFHPCRSLEPASSINAQSIASAVKFVGRAWGNPFPPSAPNFQARIRDYRKTEGNIQHLLEQSPFNMLHPEPYSVRVSHGIPACQIAYLNGDKVAAFELWTQNPSAVDFLGRTLAHIVVENCDPDFLREMANSNIQALDCRCDARGMTLLAIAVYSGCNSCFDIMREVHGIVRPEEIRYRWLESYGVVQPQQIGFRWLDLALASGSAHIVSKVLDLNLTPPPYQRAIRIAIQLGRADFTELMIQWVFDHCKSSKEEVQKLRQLAEEKLTILREERRDAERKRWTEGIQILDNRLDHMKKLVVKLKVRQLIKPSPGDALGSLRELIHRRGL